MAINRGTIGSDIRNMIVNVSLLTSVLCYTENYKLQEKG